MYKQGFENNCQIILQSPRLYATYVQASLHYAARLLIAVISENGHLLQSTRGIASLCQINGF